ncbi:MAG: thioredoxin domain-containing protein [Maricaulaceae bacterium]
MFKITQTDSRFRALAISSLAAIALVACGGDDNSNANSNSDSRTSFERADDHAIGNPDAKITLVEHASVVCVACRNWHETVYPDFKKKYIDKGHVRFVFREFPTNPENLAQAGFLIANCAGEDKFFDNISLQFKRQPQIINAARGNGNVKDQYIAIAKAGGLSEAEFEACLANEEEITRYKAVVQQGIDAGVTGTPSFFMNGEKLARTPSGGTVFTLESFDESFAAILGVEITASDDKADTDAESESE